MTQPCLAYDKLIQKRQPEKVIGDRMSASTRLSTGLTELSMFTGGYPSREVYFRQADLTGKYHLIKKPFFFLSSLDD
jgi:hypothetical protein